MVDVDDINTDKCSFKTIKVGDRRWHVYQHVVNFLWSKISRNDTYTRIICDILGIEANGPLPPERHQSKYVHNSFTIRTTDSMPKAVNSSVQKKSSLQKCLVVWGTMLILSDIKVRDASENEVVHVVPPPPVCRRSSRGRRRSRGRNGGRSSGRKQHWTAYKTTWVTYPCFKK